MNIDGLLNCKFCQQTPVIKRWENISEIRCITENKQHPYPPCVAGTNLDELKNTWNEHFGESEG